MRYKAFFQIIFSLFVFSAAKTQQFKYKPVVKPEAITKDLMSWLVYDKEQMKWGRKFHAFDTVGNNISKMQFLQHLSTGNFLPVRLRSRVKDSIYYQLYTIQGNMPHDIINTINQKAATQLNFYRLTEDTLPDFSFKDIDDTLFSNSTISGKIVLIKCWFISCIPCIAEMPRLNKLKEEYKERRDIAFISMAFDNEELIRKFLTKTIFSFSIIPNSENYLRYVLKIQGYPAHILINKEGKVVIVSNNLDDVVELFKEEVSKSY
jgi:thiol-disulfide isomerase/thioredoxin